MMVLTLSSFSDVSGIAIFLKSKINMVILHILICLGVDCVVLLTFASGQMM